MTERIIPYGDVSLSTDLANSIALESSRVILASKGVLFGLTGYNAKITAQFIQLHDASALPADAAVPLDIITVPASSNFSFDFGVYGKRFGLGIIVCNSSTAPTKTIGVADCWFSARYKANFP